MAATEYDIIRDEQERSSLRSVIADVEMAIAASPPGTLRTLENTLENVKKRVMTLEKKIEVAKVEHAAEIQGQAAAAALAAKETKLSEKEREEYRGFLEESYFTKRDFGKLDEFYQHGYDRLSEDGKEEMSKRLHEGVRRGEFKSGDLPQSVQKRDAKLYRGSVPVPISSVLRDDKQKYASGAMADDEIPVVLSSSPNPKINFGSVDLSSIQLVAASSEPTTAAIPNAAGRDVNGRS